MDELNFTILIQYWLATNLCRRSFNFSAQKPSPR